MANTKPTFLVTGKVRLSYEHLTKPYANQPGAEPKYSATLLIPKSDVTTKQKIDNAIKAAIQEGVTGKWGGIQPAQPALPLYDGDGLRLNGEPFGDECRGHWVMTASSRQRPEVVDLNLQTILDATEIYSGMYARVSINFFAYFNSGKKGIGCGLNNVQKVADGEPLSGRTTANEDFADQTQYAQPQTPQYIQPQTTPYAQPQYAPAVNHPAQPAINPITGMPM